MQSLHDSSIFLTKITGAPNDYTLGHISPKSSNSFNFIVNSFNSSVDIRYGILTIDYVPGFKSIASSNSGALRGKSNWGAHVNLN
jgi:hypothetical protein